MSEENLLKVPDIPDLSPLLPLVATLLNNASLTLFKALDLREALRVPPPPLAADCQSLKVQRPPATFAFGSKANHYPPL
jgi:hypothetical protein